MQDRQWNAERFAGGDGSERQRPRDDDEVRMGLLLPLNEFELLAHSPGHEVIAEDGAGGADRMPDVRMVEQIQVFLASSQFDSFETDARALGTK